MPNCPFAGQHNEKASTPIEHRARRRQIDATPQLEPERDEE